MPDARPSVRASPQRNLEGGIQMIDLSQLRPVLRLVCIYSWEFLHTEDWDGLLCCCWRNQSRQGIALHEVILLLLLERDGTLDFQLIQTLVP